MASNPVLDAMAARASICQYADQVPPDGVVEVIVRAGRLWRGRFVSS